MMQFEHVNDLAVQRNRRLAKIDHDAGRAPRHALARAQIERHALPAPVLHLQAHGHEGFGARSGSDAGLLLITVEAHLVDPSRRVLAEHNRVARNRHGPNDFAFLQHNLYGLHV